MKLQRVLCLLAALALLLTGCGGNEDAVPTDSTTTTQTSTTESKDSGSSQTKDTKTTKKTTTTTTVTTKGAENVNYEFFRMGDGLKNSYWKLKNEKELTVAFMGGSVTYGVGCDNLSQSFRIIVKDWLKKQFPDATVTEINAAYPSACSAYGVYAVDDFVIAQKADLVFIEYGVNDKYAKSRYTVDQVKANYETILRKLYTADATCDVVALYVTDSSIASNADAEPLYEHAAAQEEVATYYGIPSINVGWKMVKTYALGSGSSSKKWSTFFSDSVHATTTGNQAYGKIITTCLKDAFDAAESSGVFGVTNKTLPAAKSNDLSMKTKYVKADAIALPADWRLSPATNYPYIYTGTAGSELTYTFTGTGISLFLDGTDMTLEYAVDGAAHSQEITGYYHLPLPLVSGLSNGEHTITIKAPSTTTAGNTFKIKAILVRQ
ncbi:MAG: hypothetical protein IJP14_02365 [Clostridia bacterium]|nr:hypothetical protein [Clostridia bacterium]